MIHIPDFIRGMSDYDVLETDDETDYGLVKLWTKGVQVEDEAKQQ